MPTLDPASLTTYTLAIALLIGLLDKNHEESADDSRTGFHTAMTRGMLLVPPLIVTAIVTLLLAVLHVDVRLRFIHALFTLGLWMSTNLMLLTLMRSFFAKRLSAVAAVGVALTLPLAVMSTPLTGYTTIFPPESALPSAIAGLALAILSFWKWSRVGWSTGRTSSRHAEETL